ncbi:MAG: purine/pyrimidine permease [Pararhodobacter sp.]|nr:purine/pyrimidine permease [Pararhodobacter sp.]
MALLARPEYRDCRVTDSLEGAPAAITAANGGDAHPVMAGRDVLGHVHGANAGALAASLSAVAELDIEGRALAADALDRYRELSMLYSVTDRFLAVPDIEDVARIACDEAQRFTRCDGVAVLLLNEESGTLDLVASLGAEVHSRSSLPLDHGLLADILRSGSGEIVNDLAADSRAFGAENDLRSIACSPLKSKNRVIGLIIAGNETQRDFSAGDLQLLTALASQAAAAIDVARLYGEIEAATTLPSDLVYGLNDTPPPRHLLLLAVQHVVIALVMLPVPVLVGQSAGLTGAQTASLVSMTLIAMGIATLLQLQRLGPVGSGFLAPQIPSAIYLPPTLLAAQAGGLALVFGMTFLAGAMGLALSQIIGRLRKLFPPEVCGVVVLMIGLSLIKVALPLLLGLTEHRAVVDPRALAVGTLTLLVMVTGTVSRRGSLRLYAAILGLLTGYAAALAIGLADAETFQILRAAPWLSLPDRPAFALSVSPLLMLPFLIAALASNIKVVGLITSAQRANDPTWKRPDMASARGGIIADAAGNLSSGILGGVGTSVSGSNIGLAQATGATSRVIGVLVAAIFVTLAFVPKLTLAVTLMPGPVIAAGLLFTSCFLLISGIELIVSRLIDARRTFIIGLSVLAGVGLDLVPEAASEAPDWAAAFLGSPLAFATTVVVILNLLLGLGVIKRTHLVLKPEEPARDVIRFLERWGAAWGARRDVIQRAGSALRDLCEELRAAGLESDITLTVAFDEFRLTAEMRWIDERMCEVRQDLERSLGHMRRRYGCRLRFQQSAESDKLLVDFDH